jgi:hypothetical protein
MPYSYRTAAEAEKYTRGRAAVPVHVIKSYERKKHAATSRL